MVFPFLGFICSRIFQSCSKSGPEVWEVALPAFRCQRVNSSACWAGAACSLLRRLRGFPALLPGGSQLWGGDAPATVQIGKPASHLK